MFGSVGLTTSRPYFYEDLEKISSKYGCKNVMRKIFENRAFQENPYRFTLKILIDEYCDYTSDYDVAINVLVKGLPNFKESATIDLVKEIARERFKNPEQSQQMLQAFTSSVNDPNFLTYFELCKDTNDIRNLNTLLINVFREAREGKNLTVDKKYITMQENINCME